MKKDRRYWEEVESVFSEAAELGPNARAQFLDERCGTKTPLREEVMSLLAADTDAGRFIMPIEPTEPAVAVGEGDEVGAFRLGEELGTGGMASVYLGHRIDGDFDQRVAVKLIATPIADPNAARRFHAERQILASLQHSNIVTLLDGGVTRDGRGFLVMEHVKGVPITRYCRSHTLSLDARVELFRSVCAAAHYAHRHGIVHRDLKPENILVTEDSVPKVLDFGIAKLLDTSAHDATVTQFGPGPLTPDYASPEQLRGVSVTTSSDVYSLGVLLFELLTGSRPYQTSGKAFDEVLELVIEIEPPRPSATDSGESLPYAPARALRGDLDAITLKALAKSPDDRYGSVDELSADLKRYLEGEPIAARPPSILYLARKLAAKYRVGFAVAALSLVLIGFVTVLALWQARVARLEREKAEHRLEEVRAMANTLIFDVHDAVAPLPGSTAVREKIVREALRYLERLAPDADNDIGLAEELGRAYARIGSIQGRPGDPNLGNFQGALENLERARSILKPLATVEDARIETVTGYVDAMISLSGTLGAMDRRADARSVMDDALRTAELLRKRYPDSAEVLSLVARTSFSAASAHGYPDSLPYWRGAETIYASFLESDPDNREHMRNAALIHKYLGSYFYLDGEIDKAAEHHERALALDQSRLSQLPGDLQAQFDVAIDFSNLGTVRLDQGELEQAASFFERSLAYRQALADADPENALASTRLAYMHVQLGLVSERLDDAVRAQSHARTAIAIYGVRPGSQTPPDIFEEAKALWLLARLEAAGEPLGASCSTLKRAVAKMRSVSEENRAAWNAGKGDPLPKIERQLFDCRGPTPRPGASR